MLAHILSNAQKRCEMDLISALGITKGLVREAHVSLHPADSTAASYGGLEGEVLKTEVMFTLYTRMGRRLKICLIYLQGPRAASWHVWLAQEEG